MRHTGIWVVAGLSALAVIAVAVTSYDMYGKAARAVGEDLDRRIAHAARETARTVGEQLRAYPPQQWSPDELLRLSAQLESIRLASDLETLFVFDPDRRCIVDARPRVEAGKQYTFLELPAEAPAAVASGRDLLRRRPAPGGIRFRSIAVPLLVDGAPRAGVYARASIEFEDSLVALRGKWIASTALSISMTLTLVLILAVLFRRSRRLHEAMQRRSRLAMVHQLSAGIAHDIKGPLTVMRFAASEVKDPAHAAPMQTLQDGIAQILDVLNNLLGTGSGMTPERIELAPFLSALVRRLLPAAVHKGVTISADCPADLRVRAPATPLRMTLANLVHNAVEAVPPTAGRVTIGIRTSGGRVGIAISDNGPGIPRAMQRRIFDPLITTKEHGSGLGLPVARQLVEDMHGRLEFESVPGEGTTFVVWLPGEE